jgi:hypothetical protein
MAFDESITGNFKLSLRLKRKAEGSSINKESAGSDHYFFVKPPIQGPSSANLKSETVLL